MIRAAGTRRDTRPRFLDPLALAPASMRRSPRRSAAQNRPR
ncbi:Hypothetical protein A7982_00272 [Minicystis rosea]|nr:Hypothetical protein A7982_00272 [Minicystis rosea]